MKKLVFIFLFFKLFICPVWSAGQMFGSIGYSFVYSSNGYLPQTNTYLSSDAALSALSTPIQDAVNRWFLDIYGYTNGSYTTYDVHAKIIAAYLILGGTSSSVAVNAVNPGTYNLTHTGSPTITSTSIAYNGSSQYSDCGFTPSNSATTSDMGCFGVYRSDANEDINASIGIASTGNSYMIIRSDNFRSAFAASNSLVSGAGTLSINALWALSYSSSTVGNAYRNGTNIKTNTSLTFDNCGNRTFYLGACHASASVIYGGANTIIFAWIGNDTWSDNEQTFMYNAINALNTAVSR